jgi:DNA-binding GntR family transcriptional regulator
MEMQVDMRTPFKKRRQRSLVDEVRDEIERMILHGEVAAGERLNEINLAEQLGVSRSPVRQAARSLEQQGLVTAVTNQGMFVREVSLEDALELYDLRAMIAGQLCAKLAEHASPKIKTEIRSFVVRMNIARTDGDEGEYFKTNLEFHDYIADVSGATRAKALYNSLGKEVRLWQLRVLTDAQSLTLSYAEHDRIATAIEQSDVDAARREGAQHHINGKARLFEAL